MTRRVRFLGEMCDVHISQYEDGGAPAIWLTTREGEPMAKATCNLSEERLDDGEVFIKDWSENSGMLAALVNARIVEDTGRRVRSGFVEVPVARLLVSAEA